MTDDLDELRHQVAAMHGLPEQAAGFLSGETLTEIEASADALARLFAVSAPETGQTPEPDALTYAITNASTVKAARQRALVDALHPRPQPSRDEQGRFASFDGGFRGGAPVTGSPETEHSQLIVSLALRARAYGSGGGQF
jgi:hypothetical protein